uniref:Epidermal growth factor-like protein 7 n=1 Tax=Sus scrofa TaxID=9823 RepID=A0A8D1M4A6_PIG
MGGPEEAAQLGVPTVAQWVKNLTAPAGVTGEAWVRSPAWHSGLNHSALQCRSHLQLRCSPWQGNFHMLPVWTFKKKKSSPARGLGLRRGRTGTYGVLPCAPGHPEEKAVPPGNTGHVGLPGAASGVVPGAGSRWHRARLPAWVSRRVCVVGVPRGPVSESFVQRVYQPFLTTCDGYRACSTYRTIYRTAYRRSPGPAPARPRYACCPGWKRTSGLPGACGAAICHPPCQNGGSCVRPGRCHCPAGWRGDTCQTDVDECSAGGGGCPQHCVNTAGSYWCHCPEGHSPSVDRAFCLPRRGTSRVAPNPTTGADSAVKEEVQRLQSRVDVLEQKLQLVLAPLHSLASRALEHGLPDPGSLLAHSLQQLDRIDSLSEQISLLEEQLGSCSCKKEL